MQKNPDLRWVFANPNENVYPVPGKGRLSVARIEIQ